MTIRLLSQVVVHRSMIVFLAHSVFTSVNPESFVFVCYIDQHRPPTHQLVLETWLVWNL